jgi:hypothetical protein
MYRDLAYGIGGILIVVLGVILVIGIVIQVFYLLTLSKTLQQVQPHNRRMEPGQVWLMFIPLFNVVWRFLMVNYIAESLRNEFNERNMNIPDEKPGTPLGTVYASLYAGSLIGNFIPIIGPLIGLGGLVCWIIYWVKIAGYKTQLENTPGGMHNPNNFGQFQQPQQSQQWNQQNPPTV